MDRLIEDERSRKLLIKAIEQQSLPFVCDIVEGPRRSSEQNRLSHKWYAEIARHFGDRTAEEVRAECKLRFGVPILRAENSRFRAAYDAHIKGLPYHVKREFVLATDLPVTRIMTRKQLTRYLDEVCRHYTSEGVTLTQPDGLEQAA